MQNLQFNSYYNENYNALLNFALLLTRSRMDAEDLVQDTAIKAYSNFDSFIKNSSFKNWAFTILKNTFNTRYRKRKKMNVVSLPVEDLPLTSSNNINIEPKENKEAELLKKSIDKLSPKSKQTFEMYVNGYSYEEISSNMEIPIGTVKSRINYAKESLRKLVK